MVRRPADDPGSVSEDAIARARSIRLVLTDCDGVLTDGGAYYSDQGELLKRFSLRDGMGVERLRVHAGVETGLVTRETAGPVRARAEKLGIVELHLGALDKAAVVREVSGRLGFALDEIAFLRDDVHDLPALDICGLSACPADAFPAVRERVDFVCPSSGGHGAFRDLAEFVLRARLGVTPVP